MAGFSGLLRSQRIRSAAFSIAEIFPCVERPSGALFPSSAYDEIAIQHWEGSAAYELLHRKRPRKRLLSAGQLRDLCDHPGRNGLSGSCRTPGRCWANGPPGAPGRAGRHGTQGGYRRHRPPGGAGRPRPRRAKGGPGTRRSKRRPRPPRSYRAPGRAGRTGGARPGRRTGSHWGAGHPG